MAMKRQSGSDAASSTTRSAHSHGSDPESASTEFKSIPSISDVPCELTVEDASISHPDTNTAKLVYPSGDIYEGGWKDGKKEGWGTYLFKESGNLYEGEWRRGLKHGRGIFTYSLGDRYQGEWHTNLMHGHGVYTYRNGTAYMG
eukprot:TRINITY_DN24066_c0_g1_i1.p1 TRINITY_DN24066_c0_g1~~TRINITY_DN24066_c0_g1_i1.p1  ORF type:complete len:144 (-),score=10.82 TRINITY_DN24066_c0_g1_i1:188-619(-)